jgi:hypothetical protein
MLAEKQVTVVKAERQKRGKEFREKLLLKMYRKTTVITKKTFRRLQLHSDVESKKHGTTECIICGESFNEDWIQCDFVTSEHMRIAQTGGNPLSYECSIRKTKNIV